MIDNCYFRLHNWKGVFVCICIHSPSNFIFLSFLSLFFLSQFEINIFLKAEMSFQIDILVIQWWIWSYVGHFQNLQLSYNLNPLISILTSLASHDIFYEPQRFALYILILLFQFCPHSSSQMCPWSSLLSSTFSPRLVWW